MKNTINNINSFRIYYAFRSIILACLIFFSIYAFAYKSELNKYEDLSVLSIGLALLIVGLETYFKPTLLEFTLNNSYSSLRIFVPNYKHIFFINVDEVPVTNIQYGEEIKFIETRGKSFLVPYTGYFEIRQNKATSVNLSFFDKLKRQELKALIEIHNSKRK